jgi:methyltransferase (TIGR00027 family)
MVALLRAFGDLGLSHVSGFRDPTARHMLAPGWAKRLARMEAKLKHGKPSTALEMARHGADMMALRTLVIDEHVRNAVREGKRQLVILGAGLDGRAYRLTELGDVDVFEVDHPATQSFKKQRAADLPRVAKSIVFVEVDFERDRLEERLARAGYRASLPTVWLWEGVVMYLTREATRETLRSIASSTAASASLIINYHTQRRSWLVNQLLRLWSEPQIGEWTPAEITSELDGHGFRVVADTSAADWAAQYRVKTPRYGLRDAVRVLLARRADRA